MALKRSDEKKNNQEIQIRPENIQAKRLMWISVTIFMIAIVAIWGWSIKIKIDQLKIDNTPESSLIQKSKAEWKTIFVDNQQIGSSTNTNMATTTTQESTSTIYATTSIISTTSTDKIKEYLEKILTTSTNTNTNTIKNNN